MNNQTLQPHEQSSAWILFILSLSVGVAMIGLGIIWPLMPVYAVELGITGFQLGLIIAALNIARTIFNPISGRLSDRWGRKLFIMLGLFLYAFVSVLYVISTRAVLLFLVRLLHGIASVLVVPVALALAADIAPQQRLGLYTGTLNMAVWLGLGIGPAFGGFIREHFGMPVAFYSMGGLAFITLVGVTAFLPKDGQRGIVQNSQPLPSLRSLLKHRNVQGLFLMRFFIAVGQGCVYIFLPILALHMRLNSAQVGLILGANIIVVGALQRSFGSLADRVNPKHMVIWGTFLSGLAVLTMPIVDGFIMIFLLNIVMGIANGIAMSSGLVIVGQIGKTKGIGSMMGITEAGWSFGLTISIIMSGLIMDCLGVPSIFLVGGGVTIIGALLNSFFLKVNTNSLGEAFSND